MDAHQHIQVKRSPRQQRRRRTLAWLDPAESCKGGSKGAMLGGFQGVLKVEIPKDVVLRECAFDLAV
jgi:hypothetical protein